MCCQIRTKRNFWKNQAAEVGPLLGECPRLRTPDVPLMIFCLHTLASLSSNLSILAVSQIQEGSPKETYFMCIRVQQKKGRGRRKREEGRKRLKSRRIKEG